MWISRNGRRAIRGSMDVGPCLDPPLALKNTHCKYIDTWLNCNLNLNEFFIRPGEFVVAIRILLVGRDGHGSGFGRTLASVTRRCCSIASTQSNDGSSKAERCGDGNTVQLLQQLWLGKLRREERVCEDTG